MPERSTRPMNTYQESPYSVSSFSDFFRNNFALLVVAALFFLGGFFFGSIWTERNIYKNGGGPVAAAPAAAPAAAAPAGDTGPTKDQLAKMPALTNKEHVIGGKNPQVTLVEYSDFECPFCAQFHPTIRQVLQDYGDKVQVVYRTYPLPFHPNAQKAAEAGECITKLGGNDAFWKYEDAIFPKQEAMGGKLSPDAINEIAGKVGVNMAQFKSCLDSGEMADVVKQQMDGGTLAGVSGTPSTIVVTKDGPQEIIGGAYPLAQVKATIDKYVK